MWYASYDLRSGNGVGPILTDQQPTWSVHSQSALIKSTRPTGTRQPALIFPTTTQRHILGVCTHGGNDPKFELDGDFCTVLLQPEFHYPTFSS